MLQISSCFRFHAFAERTECVEFPASALKDGDSVNTWNSRKLKGKPPPGTWDRKNSNNNKQQQHSVVYILTSDFLYAWEIKHHVGTNGILFIIYMVQGKFMMVMMNLSAQQPGISLLPREVA